jgi:protein-S-isoprenylcysteine O-methyltransferase Ste14
MATIALCLCLAYLVVVFVLRSVLQKREFGSSGWLGGTGATPAERVANLLFVVGCGLDLLAPTLVLTGRLRPWAPLDSSAVHAVGIALLVGAIVAANMAQRTMGAEWRTGIAPGAPSRLVTSGPFAIVRNPVYTTMVASSSGVGLLVPTVIGLVAVPLCLLSLEVQTRLVEEPFLLERHGGRYLAYAGTVGRFLPRIGRLRRSASP